MKSFLDSDYDVRVSLNVHAYKLESRSRTTVFPPSPLKERKVFFTQLTMSRLNEVIFFLNFFFSSAVSKWFEGLFAMIVVCLVRL